MIPGHVSFGTLIFFSATKSETNITTRNVKYVLIPHQLVLVSSDIIDYNEE